MNAIEIEVISARVNKYQRFIHSEQSKKKEQRNQRAIEHAKKCSETMSRWLKE